MELLLLTADPTPASVLPAVDLLPVRIRSAAPEAASLVTSGPYDLLLLDARHDLAAARTLCRLLGRRRSRGLDPGHRHRGRHGGDRPGMGRSDVVLAIGRTGRGACPAAAAGRPHDQLRQLRA